MSGSDSPGIGCGIWPLLLEKTRFYPACSWHDVAYTTDSWAQKNLTRKQVDDWFLKQNLLIAGDNKYHRARAYLFYGIARAVGALWWEGSR